MKAIDEMISRITLRIKQMLKKSHFDNDYTMLKRLYQLLQLVENVQFMRFTKKFYSLKIIKYKNMIKFLTHIKILNEKITITKMNFTRDKQMIICIMRILDERYQNLNQI